MQTLNITEKIISFMSSCLLPSLDMPHNQLNRGVSISLCLTVILTYKDLALYYFVKDAYYMVLDLAHRSVAHSSSSKYFTSF